MWVPRSKTVYHYESGESHLLRSFALIPVLLALLSGGLPATPFDPGPADPVVSTPSGHSYGKASYKGESDVFVVRGISGRRVVLTDLWVRGCVPGVGGNDWTFASRTIIGVELTTTMVDYQNGSETPDCSNGRVGSSAFTQQLKNDRRPVRIGWVDEAGEPAAAPAGLERVRRANGASGLMTAASVTPETDARADQLNQFAFCGFTDWAANVTRDTVECFTGGVNPGLGSIVVDDRTTPWKIYDGVGVTLDRNGYPTDMPNFLPHMGPFPLPEG